MSLASMALQPERAHNWIYAIVPFSIGIAIAGPNATDLGVLTLIGVFALFVTIFLYETAFDEYLVRYWYSRIPKDKSDDLRRTFLVWNAILESWGKSLETLPILNESRVDLIGQVEQTYDSVVEGQAVSEKLWRVRASIMVFISIPFITNFILKSAPNIFSAPALIAIASNDIFILMTILVFLSLFYLIANYRQREIPEEIAYLVKLRKLQQLIAYDLLVSTSLNAITDMKLTQSRREKIRNELEYLDTIIDRGDIAIFIQRWRPIMRNLTIRGEIDFLKKLPVILYKILRWHTSRDDDQLQTGRVLGWLIHYAREACELLPEQMNKTLAARIKEFYQEYLKVAFREKEIPKGIISIIPRELLKVKKEEAAITKLDIFDASTLTEYKKLLVDKLGYSEIQLFEIIDLADVERFEEQDKPKT